jgi:hypothetical protein
MIDILDNIKLLTSLETLEMRLKGNNINENFLLQLYKFLRLPNELKELHLDFTITNINDFDFPSMISVLGSLNHL